MPRKNKLDVVNNVISKIKVELEEDTLSNIREMLNGLSVAKLEKYIDAGKEYLEDEIKTYNKVDVIVVEKETEVVDNVTTETHTITKEEVKVESDPVTDETIARLKAKEEGKDFVAKEETVNDTRTFVVDEQIEKEKEIDKDIKSVDNNTISFFEGTNEELTDIKKENIITPEEVVEKKEKVKNIEVQSDEDFFGMKDEDTSGLLKASGIEITPPQPENKEVGKVVIKVEEKVVEQVVVEADEADDFWNS